MKLGTDFHLGKQIAKGGGGLVHLGDALSASAATYGPVVVVKTIGTTRAARTMAELDSYEQAAFKQEISLMHLFRNERNVAKLVGWSNIPACLVMKYYPLGSMDKWIYSQGIYKSKRVVLQFINDISRGLMAVHQAGFAHCDLKPQNILLDEDSRGIYCCLTDFGVVQVVNDRSLQVKSFAISEQQGLSFPYAPPETMIRFRNRDTLPMSSEQLLGWDMYSLSMIMVEVLTRSRPFRYNRK